MALGPVIAFGQQPGREIGDHIAVFRMHQRHGAKLGATLERGIHLVILHHQRALVRHEMLEGVDALFLNDGFHLIKHLLAPPGDRHVIGIIAMGATRLVVPTLQRFEQRLAGAGQAEIDNHRRPARQRGARAGFEIVG